MPNAHLLFYLLAALIIGATVLTVTSRHPVHAVVHLILSLVGSGLLFYLLGAPMLAALEVILYAGGIMVLFLIVVMSFQAESKQGVGTLLRRAAVTMALSGTGFAIVVFWLQRNPGSSAPLAGAMVPPREFGAFIFEQYWLAVEVVSLLLFVALVGAYYLSRGAGELRITNYELGMGEAESAPTTTGERP